MIEVNKRDYKRALQWGFVPQNRVVHSIHRRHYYLSDSDFSQFINVLLSGYPKKQEELQRPDSLLSN